MRSQLLASLALTSFGVIAAQPAAKDDSRWDGPRLKQCLTDLGYEPKELSADKKWEVKVTTEKFNIPVSTELSTSGNYIWLTAFLGAAPTDETAGKLLRRNFKIQPSQFYVTDKGNLLIGLACENRAMSNAIMRKALDKLCGDVASSSEDWSK